MTKENENPQSTSCDSCQDPEIPGRNLPNSAATGNQVFDIQGLDCVEEVTILKREISPLVGGEAYLSFDVLNGRMTVLPGGKTVASKIIQEKVATTGMKAIPWEPTSSATSLQRRQKIQTAYTVLSGLSILVGIILHIGFAGGYFEAPAMAGQDEIRSVNWDAITAYLKNLLETHTQLTIPVSEKIAYGFAIAFGVRYVVIKAWFAFRTMRPDMNLLMTIAVAGAIFINEWFEAATVAFLFSLSLAIEGWSIGRARRAVEALLDLAPSSVRIKHQTGGEQVIPATEATVGVRFIVAPGERIALDGEVASGSSSVNQAPITGESIPVSKHPGDEVFAGTINQEGTLEAISTKPASDTTLAQIIHMVEEAHSRRAESEQWVEKFARIYTPVVIVLALAVFIGPPLFFAENWDLWFYRALVLLVIACPCALVISTPVSIVAALACAARQGILIKGGIYLEAPASLQAIAFDKTGTLTRGQPSVTDVYPLNGHTEEELISRAAALEKRSHHPLAKAILQYAQSLEIALPNAENIEVLPGKGVIGLINGTSFWLGSRRFLLERGQETADVGKKGFTLEQAGQTVIAVGNDQHVCGLIAVADEPRDQTKLIIQALRKIGIKNLVMLTGDNTVTANCIGARTGVDEIRAELLPADKVDAVSELIKKYGNVAMIGDGINDAPALGRASLGIAMGAIGSDAAIETADIALMGDDLSKLPWLIRHSRRTLSVIRQNIIFALTVKAVFALLAFAGVATLWEAIAADVGASLLVVANGLRLLR